MRWWRRDEGFEWREYVKTTVLIRRRQRRDKIDAAKVAAVEGVKEAGRKGLATGAAGAEAAGHAAIKVAKAAAGAAAARAGAGLALLVRSLAAVRARIASVSSPANARLSAAPVSIALSIAGLLSGAAFMIRYAQFGLDGDARLLGTAALVFVAAWLWPRVFAARSGAPEEWAVGTEHAVAMSGRAQPFWPIAVASVAALSVLWLASPLVNAWVASYPMAPGGPRAPAAGEVVEGPARAAGPGLLKIGRTLVRLEGMTSLDADQTCPRPNRPHWDCGEAAKRFLDKLARGSREVSCSISGEAGGIRTGVCTAGGADIGAQLVRQGFAFADGGFFSAYAGEEDAARTSNAGVWAADAERPGEWRDRLFREAAAAAPSNCPIKGRVQPGRKTYVLPHQPGYTGVTVREKRGDRWFCTTAEAEGAGFTMSGAK